MATRCATEVTVVDQTDATAVRCWYQMSASATLPAKPTTTDASATPAGWTRSEPTISSAADAAKYVYACWQTVWGDGTCDWGDVSMSASFEASKRAWNLANSASTAATNAQNSVDNLQIGGRNYILNSANLAFAGDSVSEYRCVNVGQSYMNLPAGTRVTISFDLVMTVGTANPRLLVYNTNNKGPKAFSRVATGTGTSSGVYVYFTAAVGDTISERVHVTGYINDRTSPTHTDNWLEFYSVYDTGNIFTVSNLKMEVGTKPTDWTPAPEDVAADILTNGVEYIVGTQAAATDLWTGVTAETSLVAGKSIAYKLSAAGNSTAATLNLTLADGTQTGAKPIKMPYSTTSNTAALANVTTHYPVGSVINMTYDGTQWVISNYNTNVNQVDRTQHSNALRTASENHTGKTYVVTGSSVIGYVNALDGYQTIVAGTVVDITHPLLWGTGNVAVNKTFTNAYEIFPSCTLRNNIASWTGTQYAIAYLYGTLSDTNLTVAGITSTEPTTEDGYVYVPLGQLYSTYQIAFRTASELYAYKDGAFGKLSLREASAAAKTATNYISVDTDGIRIADADPATATTYQHQTATNTEFVVEGESVLELGGSGIRVGAVDDTNVAIRSDGLTINDGLMLKARYSDHVTIGDMRSGHFDISSNGALLIDNDHVLIGMKSEFPQGGSIGMDAPYAVSSTRSSGSTSDLVVSPTDPMDIYYITSVTAKDSRLYPATYYVDYDNACVVAPYPAHKLTVEFAGKSVTSKSGVFCVYDGDGTADSNIIVKLAGSELRVGKSSDSHVTVDGDSIGMYAGERTIFTLEGTEDVEMWAGDAGTTTTDTSRIQVGGGDWSTGSFQIVRQEDHQTSGTETYDYFTQAAMALDTDNDGTDDLYVRLSDGSPQMLQVKAPNVVLQDTSDTSHIYDMDDITTLLDRLLTVSTTTCSVGTAATSIGINYVERAGNVVTVTLATAKLASSLSAGGGTGTFATLPVGYRPSHNLYFPFMVYGQNGVYGYARIGSNGAVSLRNTSATAINTSAEIAFTGTFIIE